MYSIRSKRKRNLTREQLDRICKRHHIDKRHYQCFWGLIAKNRLTARLFTDRLLHCSNYSAAFQEIMIAAGRLRIATDEERRLFSKG